MLLCYKIPFTDKHILFIVLKGIIEHIKPISSKKSLDRKPALVIAI